MPKNNLHGLFQYKGYVHERLPVLLETSTDANYLFSQGKKLKDDMGEYCGNIFIEEDRERMKKENHYRSGWCIVDLSIVSSPYKSFKAMESE